MPVAGMRTGNAAPLKLDLEPCDIFATDEIVLNMVVLQPRPHALQGIDKGGEGGGNPVALRELGIGRAGDPIVTQ